MGLEYRHLMDQRGKQVVNELDKRKVVGELIYGDQVRPIYEGQTNFDYEYRPGAPPPKIRRFEDVATRAVEEVRITDPATGGQKGMKPAQLGAVDPRAVLEVGKVAGFGATKYARYNFARGYAWSLSFDALQRHLLAFWDGENNDPESGLPHLAHAAWHCLALLTFTLRGRGTDDRFPQDREKEKVA